MSGDLDVPIRRWPRVLAFGVGFAAAIGSYLFARPRLSSWRSWVTARLTGAPSSTAAPAVAVVGPSAGPSSAGAPLLEPPAREARPTRHRSRHRAAIKH